MYVTFSTGSRTKSLQLNNGSLPPIRDSSPSRDTIPATLPKPGSREDKLLHKAISMQAKLNLQAAITRMKTRVRDIDMPMTGWSTMIRAAVEEELEVMERSVTLVTKGEGHGL